MKNIFKVISFILTAALFGTVAACSTVEDVTYANENYSATIVEFGNYAQSIVTDETVITALKIARFSDNRTTYGGNGYERFTTSSDFDESIKFSDGTAIKGGTTYYFKVEPIKWVVIQKGMNKVMLTENILDAHKFTTGIRTTTSGSDESYYSNDWEYSEIRAWLNGSENNSFISKSFNELEQRQLITTEVVNGSESVYGSFKKHQADSVDTVYDKVFLLSYKEAVSSPFSSDGGNYDCVRMAYVTDYARAHGAWCYQSSVYDQEGNLKAGQKEVLLNKGNWWLRSIGINSIYAAVCRYNGVVGNESYNVNTETVGVRPAICI